MRKYHHTSFRIDPHGDIFRLDNATMQMPYSASTQTKMALIPESYAILGMLLRGFAARGATITASAVLELSDCVDRYVRDYRNDAAAARHQVGHTIQA